jgi:hypothetical protein
MRREDVRWHPRAAPWRSQRVTAALDRERAVKRIQAPHPREVLSPVVGVVTPAESLEQRLKQDAEATRIGLSTATRKASVSLAERDGDEVVYVSARLKDVVSRGEQQPSP